MGGDKSWNPSKTFGLLSNMGWQELELSFYRLETHPSPCKIIPHPRLRIARWVFWGFFYTASRKLCTIRLHSASNFFVQSNGKRRKLHQNAQKFKNTLLILGRICYNIGNITKSSTERPGVNPCRITERCPVSWEILRESSRKTADSPSVRHHSAPYSQIPQLPPNKQKIQQHFFLVFHPFGGI